MRPVALPAAPVVPSELELPAEEAHHLARVLRVQPGAPLRLFHGGRQWHGEVVTVLAGGKGPATVVARVLEEMEALPPLPVAVWFALPYLKGGHTEDLVRHLVESGAAGIVVGSTRRDVARLDADKVVRLQRVALEACKQSERADTPEVRALDVPLLPGIAQLRDELGPQAWAAVAAERSGERTLSNALQRQQSISTVILATGPEGGWHPEELEAAEAAEVESVSLGPRILRAETAPVIAMGVILAHLGVS